ncbi:MAG: hypothetical protein WCK39_03125 [Methanomassiliicoccales archaeon]
MASILDDPIVIAAIITVVFGALPIVFGIFYQERSRKKTARFDKIWDLKLALFEDAYQEMDKCIHASIAFKYHLKHGMRGSLSIEDLRDYVSGALQYHDDLPPYERFMRIQKSNQEELMEIIDEEGFALANFAFRERVPFSEIVSRMALVCDDVGILNGFVAFYKGIQESLDFSIISKPKAGDDVLLKARMEDCVKLKDSINILMRNELESTRRRAR